MTLGTGLFSPDFQYVNAFLPQLSTQLGTRELTKKCVLKAASLFLEYTDHVSEFPQQCKNVYKISIFTLGFKRIQIGSSLVLQHYPSPTQYTLDHMVTVQSPNDWSLRLFLGAFNS
jgi:hypothetical protein